ncbi:MAG: hypothetical protein KGZ82_05675 [Bacteroidales bacterium]|nr:hypothetical protein [Bacteroidales bacterium]
MQDYFIEGQNIEHDDVFVDMDGWNDWSSQEAVIQELTDFLCELQQSEATLDNMIDALNDELAIIRNLIVTAEESISNVRAFVYPPLEDELNY